MKFTNRLGLLAATLAPALVALADAPPPPGPSANDATPAPAALSAPATPAAPAQPAAAEPPVATGAADAQAEGQVAFTEEDKRVIREFFAPYHARVPADYAQKHALPAGHPWRLTRNRRLTDGAPWRNLHPELERKLSRLPKGYFRIAIGTDIGIVQPKTRIVVDVLEHVTP